ncbi:MAG: oligosaccharide flippase family protein [Magnetococcales bacterium]|nr:oligosaccharide flippase family protein [Magnetococcales bacterium]
MTGQVSKHKQIRHTFLYLLPTLLATLLPVLVLPLVTRVVTPEEMGLMALGQAFALFSQAFINWGVSLGYERNFFQYSASPQDSGALLFSTVVFIALSGLLFQALIHPFTGEISRFLFHRDGEDALIVHMLAGQTLVGLAGYFFTYLRNREQAATFSLYSMAMNLANVALLLWFLLVEHTGVIAYGYAASLSALGLIAIMAWRISREAPFSLRPSLVVEELKIGYPVLFKSLMGSINSQFDKYLIGLFGTLSNVGVFNIAQRASGMIFTLMTSLEQAYLPTVYRLLFEGKEENRAVLGRYLTPYMYFSLAFAYGLILGAEEVFWLLTAPEYHPGIDMAIVLALYFSTMFLMKINGTQLNYSKKVWATSFLVSGSVTLNILLNIPFIHWWGAMGAAWATLVSGMIMGGLIFRVAQRYAPIRFEVGRTVLIHALCAVAALVVLGLRQWTELSYVERLPFKVGLAGLYLYVGMRIGILTRENLKVLFASLRRS